MVKCSIIVPTKDRHSLLNELLLSLGKQTMHDFELIIIDDCSIVPVENQLNKKTFPFKIKIRRNEKVIGPGASRNIAVHLSKAEMLLFTDDDCIVSHDWVYELYNALISSGKTIAGIGGQTKAKSKDIYNQYFEFHRILDPRAHDSRNPSLIPYLVTANCGIKKELLLKAGGFDCRIPQAGGEDAAVSMRMAKLGYQFERNENAIVYHQFRKGLKELARTFYRYGLGGRYVVDRYLPL